MLNKLSYNIMNELNEADTNAIEIKKKVFMEGSNVRVEEIPAEEANLEKQQINESENLLKESKVIWSDQIDTSEETYNAEWQDAGYSSAEEAIADGFPDYDAWIEGDKYAESEILLDDLKNNILPQIENQANLDYIFLTGNYNSNYPDFRPSGSGGVTLKGINELNNYLAKWDSVTIFEEDGNIGVKCADHDGSVELMLYTFVTDNEEELAKMLGYTEDNFDEFENDLYYKSIDTNIINDHPEAIKPIADTITSFNESEEVKGKEVLNELGTDSTIDKLIAGDELYFRNNDGLALMVRYADTYDQPEDYDEGYTQGWERGADEEFDKVQDENFAKAKQAAEEGNVWEVLEIDETTLQPNGSVYDYLYGQEELAKFLKEVREVRVVKRLEESKKICEKCGKEVCECDKSINESGEDIKKDLNIEAGSDEEAELDNILDTNYNDLFDNLDDEEKEEYNKIAATIRDLKPEEALIDVIDEIESKAKENGLEKDLLIFAYLNKGKMNEAAPINSDLKKGKEDRLASLKTQLEADGDQLSDDEKKAIEKEIADLEAELFEKEKLNETGEWDDNDDEMKIWKEELRDKAEYIANEIHGSVASVSGFDKYQGPVAIISTPIHGDVQLWFDNEDDTGLSLLCKIAHVGWIQGSANYISDILSREVIPEDEIINESEKSYSVEDPTKEEILNNKIEEAEVSNLKTIKSQGNIFMLEDDNQYIVGENYNEPENIIENAEIYSTKEEADKDYFNRCGITLEESVEENLNNKSTNLYDRCYHINDREELKEIALNAIYVANNEQKIIDELNDRLVDLEKEECHDYLVKFSEAPYDFVANNYTNIPLELLREIALNAVYVANNDEAIEKEIKDRIVEYDETYKTSEKDLSKDLFGSEAEKRQSEADRALEKYLDLAREIKAGNNDTITLDSAKQLLKNAYIKAKGYYSFEPEEIDRRIAKDIPDLFGDLEEGVISDLKATHLAKKATKLSKEKDFNKSTKAFAKSMEINDKSANKLDNKAKKLEDKAGKLRNEAIVKRNKSVKDFTSKK